MYRVKEIFYTLQGEGGRAGRPAVFCRFSLCNLWTGRERDRRRAVCQFCDTDFTGTDGPGGGKFASAADLAAAVARTWPGDLSRASRAEPAAGPGRAAVPAAASRACAPDAAAPAAADPGDAGGRPAVPRDAASRPAVPGAVPRAAVRYVVCTGGEPLLQLDAEAVAALHAEGFEVAVETNGTQPVPAGVDWVCVSPKAGAELVVRAGDELKLVYPQPGAPPGQYELPGFGRLLLQPMDGPDRAANTRAAVEYCLAHPQWQLSLQTHKYLGIA